MIEDEKDRLLHEALDLLREQGAEVRARGQRIDELVAELLAVALDAAERNRVLRAHEAWVAQRPAVQS